MADDRPNVLWINLEDTSARRLGCYGDPIARTPRIDAFAAESRVYESAHCPAPVCSPSRSGTITGCHPAGIGCHHHRASYGLDRGDGQPTPYEAVPPHYVRALPEYLRRAGYYCVKNGKDDFNFGSPFTVWNTAERTDPRLDGSDWRDAPDDRPFFVSYQLPVTHESGLWEPEQTGGRAGGRPDHLTTDPEAVEVPPYHPDTDRTRRAIARLYDNLAAADEQVGTLLDRLESDGLADDTLVVCWSDHGEGLPRCKSWLYQGGLRVPLLVRWPGVVEPGRTDALASLVDLAPTTLSAAGHEVPEWMDGRDLLHGDDRSYVFAGRDRQDCGYLYQRAVFDGRFKYVRNAEPGRPHPWFPYRNRHPVMEEIRRLRAAGELSGPAAWFDRPLPGEELYDVEVDPHETDNLAGDSDHADTRDRLAGALDAWIDRTNDRGGVNESQLVAQWWPDGDQPTTATPTFVPSAPGTWGTERAPDGGRFDAPAEVEVFCPTEGASVAYAVGDGDWRLYDGPIRLPDGETRLRTRAVRYGYEPSAERSATFVVE